MRRGGPPVDGRREIAMASTSGACLCGGVRFEIAKAVGPGPEARPSLYFSRER